MTPRAPLTPCTVPYCPELADKPGKCPRHLAQYEQWRARRETWRDYRASWQKARREALARKPLCDCGSPATQVDHVIPLRNGGTHDQSNLNPLCASCHSRKTARENGFGGNHV